MRIEVTAPFSMTTVFLFWPNLSGFHTVDDHDVDGILHGPQKPVQGVRWAATARSHYRGRAVVVHGEGGSARYAAWREHALQPAPACHG